MSIFDAIMSHGEGLDLDAIGSRIGLSAEDVKAGAGQLLPKIADPNIDNSAAVTDVAAATGIQESKLEALIPLLLQEAKQAGVPGTILNNVLAGVTGGDGAAGGLWGRMSAVLDRDGDGSPIDDVLGMFRKT